MLKIWAILIAAAVVIALPFLLRRGTTVAPPANALELVIVTPQNEAIRQEFAQAFSDWHQRRHGRPVHVEWRALGGTTEILRYLGAEYVAAFRAAWQRAGKVWPAGGGDALLDPLPPRADKQIPAAAVRAAEERRALAAEFRAHDDPRQYTVRIDLFFGGGVYDHERAARQGLLVPPWPRGREPRELQSAPVGAEAIPEQYGGEVWRADTYFGTALSSFGICCNLDRLKDLGIDAPPRRWQDLADPRWAGTLGLADPTKSASIAKAFEMIVQAQCHAAVQAAGFAPARVAAFEDLIRAARLPPGDMPSGVPPAYQAAVERGWASGSALLRRIGANARYFADAGSKVPIDVSMGAAAAGLTIDFYGRFQAENSRDPGGRERMVYVAPAAGTSINADPISLLRGAEHRELAVRFIEFVLSEEGQQLWCYRPGAPGGPRKYALRRLPIRREFYPSDRPECQGGYLRHREWTADNLGDPEVNPYVLGRQFIYQPRWTGGHFNMLRDLVQAMCIDSGDELRAAWRAICRAGGPERQAAAMACLERLPDRPAPLTWRTALQLPGGAAGLDRQRDWTAFFRARYEEARRLAQDGSPP